MSPAATYSWSISSLVMVGVQDATTFGIRQKRMANCPIVAS